MPDTFFLVLDKGRPYSLLCTFDSSATTNYLTALVCAVLLSSTLLDSLGALIDNADNRHCVRVTESRGTVGPAEALPFTIQNAQDPNRGRRVHTRASNSGVRTILGFPGDAP